MVGAASQLQKLRIPRSLFNFVLPHVEKQREGKSSSIQIDETRKDLSLCSLSLKSESAILPGQPHKQK